MNIQNILFPTDFSQHTQAALGFATSLAADSGALLQILYVDDMLDVSAGLADAGYPYTWSAAMEDGSDLREQLQQVVPPNPAVRYVHHYLKGPPVTEIVNCIERHNIDLVVMGSHGRTGLSRLLMGSIAEGVMRRAPCPVLVVKQPAAEQKPAESAASQPALS